MRLTSLHLHQFRSHVDAQFTFDLNVTSIIGPNGSGKTNILEAIYTLMMGKSFRDGDDELITYDEDWYRIEGVIDETNRELRYQPSNKGKQLLIDGASKGRFTYRQQLPVVLFEPDDLLMIHGSPSARRKYLDDLLSRLSLPYRQTLHRYERALLQRNNLLKKQLSTRELSDALFAWDITLSTLGAEMIRARRKLIAEIEEVLTDYYRGITEHDEMITVRYDTQYGSESNELAHLLAQRLPQDRLRGFTTVGPHRDDIEFLMGSKSMKTTASRGEIRTLLLALKFTELSLIEHYTGDSPLFLLDDVFSELDASRQRALMQFMGGVQKIITTTHLSTKNKSQIIEL